MTCALDKERFMAQKIWLDGKLVDREDAKITVFDHGLLYGDGVFEGIRVYSGRVFELDAHIKRLYESAKAIRLTIAISQSELAGAVEETVDANAVSDGYIRLVVTRGVGTLGLNPFVCKNSCIFIIADSIQLYPEELYEKVRRPCAIILWRFPPRPRALTISTIFWPRSKRWTITYPRRLFIITKDTLPRPAATTF